jgi:hypothetical protein
LDTWGALFQQRIGELFAAPRAAADDSVQLSAHHDVAHSLSVIRGDAGFLKHTTQFLTSQLSSALQCSGQRGIAPLEDGLIQPQLVIDVGVGRMNARRSKGKQPADVGRCDEMPGGPHQVRAKDRASGEGLFNVAVNRALQAQSERPFRARIILSLHGDTTQPRQPACQTQPRRCAGGVGRCHGRSRRIGRRFSRCQQHASLLEWCVL